MRLIDADRLCADLEYMIKNTDDNTIELEIAKAYGIITKIPTICDGKNERIGEWKDTKCSICGNEPLLERMRNHFYFSKYCPFCGAKMVNGEW